MELAMRDVFDAPAAAEIAAGSGRRGERGGQRCPVPVAGRGGCRPRTDNPDPSPPAPGIQIAAVFDEVDAVAAACEGRIGRAAPKYR